MVASHSYSGRNVHYVSKAMEVYWIWQFIHPVTVFIHSSSRNALSWSLDSSMVNTPTPICHFHIHCYTNLLLCSPEVLIPCASVLYLAFNSIVFFPLLLCKKQTRYSHTFPMSCVCIFFKMIYSIDLLLEIPWMYCWSTVDLKCFM